MSTLRELKDMIEKLEKTYEDPDTQVVFSTTLYPVDNNDVYLADYCGRSFTQECGDNFLFLLTPLGNDEIDDDFDILSLWEGEEWAHTALLNRLHEKNIDCYFADMWEDVAFLIGCTSNRERVARALDMHEDCVYVDSEHCFVILNLFQERMMRGVSKCENCHHYNTLINWDEGIFEKCMADEMLHRHNCKEYDSIEEDNDEEEN